MNMNMKIERIEIDIKETSEARMQNMDNLRLGVVGTEVLLAGRITPHSDAGDQLQEYIAPGECLGSIELYADGSINLFLRNRSGRAVAFLRMRPHNEEPEIVTVP